MSSPGVAVGAVGAGAAGVELVLDAALGGTDPLTSLLQYGALGVFSVLLAIAVRVLFKRETETLERERERADKLSAELKELNDSIQQRYLVTLEQAASAIREALAITRSGR